MESSLTENGTDNASSYEPSETLSQDQKLLSYFRTFFGFFTTVLALLLLFFESPLCELQVTLGNVVTPAIALITAFIVVFLLLVRLSAGFIATHAGFVAVTILSLIGACLSPLLLLTSFWPLGIPLVALGIVLICFSWCVILCAFSHIILDWLTAVSFAAAACIAGLLWTTGLSELSTTVLICVLFFTSWLLIGFRRDRLGDVLLQISSDESRKRASTARIDRWTYSVIGVDFGFATEFLSGELQQSGLTATPTAALSVAVPIIVAGILLLIFRYNFQFTLEKYSKDFLSFCVAACVIPLAILPQSFRIIFLVLLLLVSVLQIIIVINAFFEFIRFEELSPAWYFAEGAFVGGGILIGILVAYAALFSVAPQSIQPLCCYAIVLVNTFAQVIINNGRYPNADLFSTIENTGSAEEPCQQIQGVAKGAAFWHARIDYICKLYDLSPRQSEVLELLAKGRDIAFMVEHFRISRSTAKTHIYNIYCKLDIHSRQDLLDMIDSIDARTIYSSNNDLFDDKPVRESISDCQKQPCGSSR